MGEGRHADIDGIRPSGKQIGDVGVEAGAVPFGDVAPGVVGHVGHPGEGDVGEAAQHPEVALGDPARAHHRDPACSHSETSGKRLRKIFLFLTVPSYSIGNRKSRI